VDAVRFWAARAVQFGQDGNVTRDSIQERYDRELANDLGNLVSRTTAMIARYRDGKLTRTESSPPWNVDAVRDEVVAHLDRFDITSALESIWVLVRRLNQYVEESAPWQIAKDDARADELDEVLYNLADGITAVAVALSPYLPENAPAILAALGQPGDDLSLERIRPKSAVAVEGVAPAAPLFPRVELPAAEPA
jgi:methionyl-tRNA synthetase